MEERGNERQKLAVGVVGHVLPGNGLEFTWMLQIADVEIWSVQVGDSGSFSNTYFKF